MGTVVATWRSAPRPAGASMLVGPDGTAVGSVSGGCVEGAVYEEAKDVVETGVPDPRALRRERRRRLRRGPDLRRDPRRLRRVGLARVVPGARGGRRVGREPRAGRRRHRGEGPRRPARPAAGPLARPRVRARSACSAWTTPSPPTRAGCSPPGAPACCTSGHDGERRGDELTLFVNSFAPPARMVVFGAIDFAAAVARVGAFLGYRVTVCDARPVFATPKRFPDAHEVIVEWPHRYLQAEVDAGRIDERTVLCVLTHDPKFDVPLLEVALRIPVAYVGAMGSRRTHEEREARLRRGGADRGGDRPAVLADRAGPRRPDAGGDRRVDRGGDHRRPLGRHGRAAGRHRGPIHRRDRSRSDQALRPHSRLAEEPRGYSGSGIPFPVCHRRRGSRRSPACRASRDAGGS